MRRCPDFPRKYPGDGTNTLMIAENALSIAHQVGRESA
jgi:hypothetical protein